jgi:hypothetical protein
MLYDRSKLGVREVSLPKRNSARKIIAHVRRTSMQSGRMHSRDVGTVIILA